MGGKILDINHKNCIGLTPLANAALDVNNQKTLEALIEAGASLEITGHSIYKNIFDLIFYKF